MTDPPVARPSTGETFGLPEEQDRDVTGADEGVGRAADDQSTDDREAIAAHDQQIDLERLNPLQKCEVGATRQGPQAG